jgi:hypothetical protein
MRPGFESRTGNILFASLFCVSCLSFVRLSLPPSLQCLAPTHCTDQRTNDAARGSHKHTHTNNAQQRSTTPAAVRCVSSRTVRADSGCRLSAVGAVGCRLSAVGCRAATSFLFATHSNSQCTEAHAQRWLPAVCSGLGLGTALCVVRSRPQMSPCPGCGVTKRKRAWCDRAEARMANFGCAHVLCSTILACICISSSGGAATVRCALPAHPSTNTRLGSRSSLVSRTF